MTRLPLILVAGALAVTPALAATRSEHKFAMTFSSRTPGTPTAVSFLTNRTAYKGTQAGKAADRVTTTTFTLAPGTRTNLAAFPKCSKSALKANPASGCSAASKVGTGTATVIVGTLKPTPFTATLYVAKHGLLALLVGAQTQIIGMTVNGNKIVAKVPRTCFPANCKGGYIEAVLKKLTIHLNKGKLITTPRTCPKSGKWTNSVVYQYVNGDTEKQTSTSPCK